MGATRRLLYGVYGYMLSIVTIGGPIVFLSVAIVSAMRRE